MSEKRKPVAKITIEVGGKRHKLELFPAALWPDKYHRNHQGKFRVRVNGKFPSPDYIGTTSDIIRQVRIKFVSMLKRQNVVKNRRRR